MSKDRHEVTMAELKALIVDCRNHMENDEQIGPRPIYLNDQGEKISRKQWNRLFYRAMSFHQSQLREMELLRGIRGVGEEVD